MKTKRVPRLLFALALVSIFVATWSCNDDDGPSLESLRDDRLQFLEDSLRVSDSLRLTNNAGVVNYGVTIVDGSTSSIFANGRTDKTQSAVAGAIVTISQYGKIQKDTTDASGIAVFNGFFRSAVNITVQAAGFTTVSYISAVNIQDSTRTGTISFVGNIIPVFATAGANTATITGRATIQTDLTNKTREPVPVGTAITASIDATNNSDFSDKFLTTDIDDFNFTSSCGCQFVYIGNILQATYQTGVIGSVAATANPNVTEYTITVPAAIDGLPLNLQYSELAADQTLFETSAAFGQRTIQQRTIYNDNSNTSTTPLAALPTSSSVTVAFESFTTAATATAVISANAGTLERINVTNGGNNYNGVPTVQITGGGGTGAAATALIGANGRVTGVDITNFGTGYTSAPTVTFISGAGATATVALGGTGTVIAINLLSTGEGYTGTPTVDITGGGATTNATATATVANGRVTSITLATGGVGYDGSPITVALVGGAPTTPATASAVFSGRGIGVVTLTGGGANYTYAPLVTFSAPDLPTGVRPTAVASFDLDTREVTGINVTSNGSGYLIPPTMTLTAGSGATAQAFLTGGSVISVNITGQGSGYAYPPTVVIGDVTTGGGTGATGTAIMENGRVTGINITNGGVGYITAPNITLVSGDNANAFATVSNGAISGITVTDGGRNFAGAPRVIITSANGGGATATATVAGGQITTIAINAGGTGYLEGNTPATAERFSAVKGTTLVTKPGLTYINDVYFGTGAVRNPN